MARTTFLILFFLYKRKKIYSNKSFYTSSHLGEVCKRLHPLLMLSTIQLYNSYKIFINTAIKTNTITTVINFDIAFGKNFIFKELKFCFHTFYHFLFVLGKFILFHSLFPSLSYNNNTSCFTVITIYMVR